MFFPNEKNIFDLLPHNKRREFCKPRRKKIEKEDLCCPSKGWLQKAAERFPLYEVERKNWENPLESIPAYEFDLGGAVLGFNFIGPDGLRSRFTCFLHLGYLFRKRSGAESFKKLEKLIRLLEEGENSYPLLFICKIGGSFFQFLEPNEAFDSCPAPKKFLFKSFEDLGFQQSERSFGLINNGTVLIREFNARNPSPFVASLSLEYAVNNFQNLESEFGSFLKDFRVKEENE